MIITFIKNIVGYSNAELILNLYTGAVTSIEFMHGVSKTNPDYSRLSD